MLTSPDLMFMLATERRRELEADAAQYRLLAADRRQRRAARWRAARWRAARNNADRQLARQPAPVSQPAGNLAACAASAGSAQ